MRNLGIDNYSKYEDSWIEWAYEAEKYIGSFDTFLTKELTYNSSGAQATGTITFSENPTSGDTITLNGVTLIFREDGSTSNNADEQLGKNANELRIKSNLTNTLNALIDELTFTGSNQTQQLFRPSIHYPEGLQKATYAVDTTAGTLTITANDVGFEGNEYTLEASHAKCSSATLTGGKGFFQNQQLRLPDNMVKLLGVRTGKDSTKHEHTEIRKTSAIHRGRVGMNKTETEQRAFRYYIEGNRLNVTHDEVDEITIVYLAVQKDIRGYPMVKEGHEAAIAQYIMWQHKLIDYYNAKVPQYIIKDLEKRWYFLCGQVRGEDNMPTSAELKSIGAIWNSLIPVKSSSGYINF